jgi:hypothetical protein
MKENIRIKEYPENDDIIKLNFIKSDSPYHFRRHIHYGLRSHIIQVLKKTDVDIENQGIRIDGILNYPRAKPISLLRIYRENFQTYDDFKNESYKINLIEKYLGNENMAKSHEFVVDYNINGKNEILLCGFQKYIDGDGVDPWSLYIDVSSEKGKQFTNKIKKMISEEGYIPDLSGYQNIRKDSEGNLVLVDINNVSKVKFDNKIQIDSTGFPTVDVSIEVLSLLEKKIVGEIDSTEILYKHFLNEFRKNDVHAIEKEWKNKYEKESELTMYNYS